MTEPTLANVGTAGSLTGLSGVEDEATRKRARDHTEAQSQNAATSANAFQGDENRSPKRALLGNNQAASGPTSAIPTLQDDDDEQDDQYAGNQLGPAAAAAAAASGNMSSDMGSDRPSGPISLPSVSMRCLIVTNEAAQIIGRGGSSIKELREQSHARINISESIPNIQERVLTVIGSLDCVAKGFGLIIRRLNDEPFDEPSLPGSQTVTLRFIVPHRNMGMVIGKAGAKIREIQEASGARISASESVLPGSTERLLNVSGVADAIHIAAFHIGNTIHSAELKSSQGGHANTPYNPSVAHMLAGQQQGRPLGGGQPYGPGSPMGGGQPFYPGVGTGANAYGGQPTMPTMASPHPYAYGVPSAGAGGVAGVRQGMPPGAASGGGGSGPLPSSLGSPAPPQTIYIPDQHVGAVIGKSGAHINEVRRSSGCQIKVTDESTANQERLVTISGSAEGQQMAVYMIYHKVDSEKQRAAAGM